MSTPSEHSSHSNYTNSNNEKREDTSITSINKNGDVYKRLYTRPLYNNVSNNTSVSVEDDVLEEIRSVFAERRRYAVLCIRVLPRVKLIWDSLGADEKKLIRDAVEQLVLEYSKQSRIRVENRNIVLNVNINQQIVSVDKSRDNIIRLKKEIEKLREELAKTVSENIDLKNEIERLRTSISNEASTETKRLKDEVKSLQSKLERYTSITRDTLLALLVVKKCLDIDCEGGKLVKLIDKTIAEARRHVSIRDEFIDVYMRHLKSKQGD